MQRIALRELRNQASKVVRRARAGERLIITVDGVPAAEIGPVRVAGREVSLEELVESGAVTTPQNRTPPPPPKPVRAPSGRSSTDALAELRDR